MAEETAKEKKDGRFWTSLRWSLQKWGIKFT